jgi:hypothetical protein
MKTLRENVKRSVETSITQRIAFVYKQIPPPLTNALEHSSVYISVYQPVVGTMSSLKTPARNYVEQRSK